MKILLGDIASQMNIRKAIYIVLCGSSIMAKDLTDFDLVLNVL
jgi:hypothetical protein